MERAVNYGVVSMQPEDVLYVSPLMVPFIYTFGPFTLLIITFYFYCTRVSEVWTGIAAHLPIPAKEDGGRSLITRGGAFGIEPIRIVNKVLICCGDIVNIVRSLP